MKEVFGQPATAGGDALQARESQIIEDLQLQNTQGDTEANIFRLVVLSAILQTKNAADSGSVHQRAETSPVHAISLKFI